MRKIKIKLKPYNSLKDNFTQVCNTMHQYIPDPYTFSIYFYLCMRYNPNYNYAFPSLTSIAKACHISVGKVKSSIKWLTDNKYIVKKKIKSSNNIYDNNVYYIRYIEIDKEMLEQEATDEFDADLIEDSILELEE